LADYEGPQNRLERYFKRLEQKEKDEGLTSEEQEKKEELRRQIDEFVEYECSGQGEKDRLEYWRKKQGEKHWESLVEKLPENDEPHLPDTLDFEEWYDFCEMMNTMSRRLLKSGSTYRNFFLLKMLEDVGFQKVFQDLVITCWENFEDDDCPNPHELFGGDDEEEEDEGEEWKQE